MTQHPSVLHVLNTAGVACTLAKWTQKIYGADTEVYAMEEYNRFGHITYGVSRPERLNAFFSFALRNMEKFDIIHIHEFDRFIYSLRKHYLYVLKKSHIEKPVVMHYHGTDIRGRWKRKEKFWRFADAIVVSTRDLLSGAPEKATYLPNPVDTDIFYPNPNPHEVDPNSALTFPCRAVDVAEKLADEHGLKLTIHPRNKQFLEMPDLFRQFSWYIDAKRSSTGVLRCRGEGSGSLTGLEASACGLKVINSDGEIRENLPPQHRPENAAKTLRSIYVNLMEKINNANNIE